MNPRDPLTERSAHSLRETLRDPYDWIEGTQEPQLLSERADPWHRRPWNRWDGLVSLLAVLASAAFVIWVLWLVWLWLFR